MKRLFISFLLTVLMLSVICPCLSASAAGTITQAIAMEPGGIQTRYVDGYYMYYNNQLALTVTVNGNSNSVVVGYSTGNKSISNSVVEVTVNDCNSISIKGLSVGTATVTAKCFSQHYVGSTGSDSEWVKDTTTVVYNVTVKKNGYTVSFNANGGSGAPSPQQKTEGEALTLSTQIPTRDGYVFQGWALNSAASNPAYQPGDSYNTDSDVTLYAVWKLDHYVIKYNANGGTGAPVAQNKTPGTAIWLSSVVPIRQGYAFQGWAESATATVAAYQPGNSFSKDAFVTLYAVWQMIPTQSISINKSSTTIYVDSTEQLTATVLPANAPQSATWSSSDSTVATVSSVGLVAGKAEGTATITATTVDGRQAQCIVTVIPDPAKKVKLDSSIFPDYYFRTKLSTFDKDKNGYLGESEIAQITYFDAGDHNIQSLEGIKYLTSLKTLDCAGSKIQNLDLRGCLSLEKVEDAAVWSGNVSYDYLKTIRVDGCISLKKLDLWCCDKLTSINANGCTSLYSITAACDILNSIQLSGCTSLKYLDLQPNSLTTLNLSDCYELETLNCTNSQKLKTLDIRHCPKLLDIYFYGERHKYEGYYGYFYDYCYNDKYLSFPTSITIYANASLEILKQPVNVTVSIGETAKFHTFATGIGLSYRWQEYANGTWTDTALDGYNTATLSVKGAAMLDGSKYHCIVTDASGESVCSETTTLTIAFPAFGIPDFVLPLGIKTVESHAFEGIAAHIVTVPVGCTGIADCAFSNSSVQHIRIPAGCTLGAGVFDGCEAVYIFGIAGSPAETYCSSHSNCIFVREGY